MLVCLFNQRFKYLGLLHEYSSQSDSAHGSHWAQSLVLSPTCESVFHFQTHSFGLMCLCISHLFANSTLRLRQAGYEKGAGGIEY